MSTQEKRIFKIKHLDLGDVARALTGRTTCPIEIEPHSGIVPPNELYRVRRCVWEHRTNGNFKYAIEAATYFFGVMVIAEIRLIVGDAPDNLESDIIFTLPSRNGLDLVLYDF